jgi:hypothetical protein
VSFGALIRAAVVAGIVAVALPSQANVLDTLAVSISATFDRSVSSALTRSIAQKEASEIWRDYGVEISWNNAVEPALHFDVVVAGSRTEHEPLHSFSILGRTELNGTGAVTGPIRVNVGAIEELLENRYSNSVVVRERELGRALGRVLAHELGHALLGVPSFHDGAGLMRATIPVEELVSPDRRFLQLEEASVNRLQARMPCLLDSAGAGTSSSLR